MKTILRLFLEGLGITIAAIILSFLGVREAIIIGCLVTGIRVLKDTKNIAKELRGKKKGRCVSCKQVVIKK